jgi:hypothetical protein
MGAVASRAHPVQPCVGGQQAGELADPPLARCPLRLQRAAPGTLAGQAAAEQPDPAARLRRRRPLPAGMLDLNRTHGHPWGYQTSVAPPPAPRLGPRAEEAAG